MLRYYLKTVIFLPLITARGICLLIILQKNFLIKLLMRTEI